MPIVRGTVNLPDVPVGAVYTDAGTFTSSTFVVNTGTLNLYYDASNYLTVSVSSTGVVTANTIGTSTGFTINTPGELSLGDKDGIGDRTSIEINDTDGYINVHCSTGPITIGDVFLLSTETTLVVNNATQQFTFSNGDLVFSDGVDILIGEAVGTRIGTADNQLIGFWGNTPVPRVNVYTIENVFPSHVLDASSATLDQLRQFVGTMAQELAMYGLFGLIA